MYKLYPFSLRNLAVVTEVLNKLFEYVDTSEDSTPYDKLCYKLSELVCNANERNDGKVTWLTGKEIGLAKKVLHTSSLPNVA